MRQFATICEKEGATKQAETLEVRGFAAICGDLRQFEKNPQLASPGHHFYNKNNRLEGRSRNIRALDQIKAPLPH